jgi:hypothetical protein
VIDVTDSAALPLFVSVTVFAAAAVVTNCDPNATVLADSVTAGAGTGGS